MPKIKWSSFTSGGAVTTGDETVGLRAGTNVRFDATEFEIINVDDVTIDGDTISTNTVNGNLYLEPNGTGHVDVGDPGLEVGNILIDGIPFNSRFRVNDIGNTAPAMVTIHKHSTAQEPLQIAARSNSDTSAHATVTANMPLYSMYATGWLNSYYGIFGQMRFSADSTGTLADGSAPGKIELMVTPDGSVIPVTALSISNAGVTTLAKDAIVNTVNIGLGAGNIATNTRVGVTALAANTTGARIVSVGYQAAYTSTTANDVTAIGYQALTLNTVANNTAIGSGAMDAVTTGTGVAVGKDALGAMTTGAGNTAIGTSALFSLTTSSSCTAVGFQAGLNNTQADNAFFGFQAGYNNTTGQYSTAVGMGAGRAWNTGNGNTAVGQNSMGLLGTTGVAFNTWVGTFAAYSTTGNNNTGVGYFAGYSGATGAVALTTGASNTLLGYRSCPNAADAAGTIGIGADSVPEKATGATSADNGPGIAIGSAAFKVGFRGDGTIYPTAGAISGYMQVKINGTAYKLALYALS